MEFSISFSHPSIHIWAVAIVLTTTQSITSQAQSADRHRHTLTHTGGRPMEAIPNLFMHVTVHGAAAAACVLSFGYHQRNWHIRNCALQSISKMKWTFRRRLSTADRKLKRNAFEFFIYGFLRYNVFAAYSTQSTIDLCLLLFRTTFGSLRFASNSVHKDSNFIVRARTWEFIVGVPRWKCALINNIYCCCRILYVWVRLWLLCAGVHECTYAAPDAMNMMPPSSTCD